MKKNRLTILMSVMAFILVFTCVLAISGNVSVSAAEESAAEAVEAVEEKAAETVEVVKDEAAEAVEAVEENIQILFSELRAIIVHPFTKIKIVVADHRYCRDFFGLCHNTMS